MSDKDFKIAHIAVASSDLSSVMKTVESLFGCEASEVEEVKSEKVKLQFADLGGVRFEFLEPTQSDSPISKFLEKRKGGIHHIAFYVSDIDAKLAEFKQKGIPLLDEKAKPGAEGCRVAFLHPKACGGILVELIQKKNTPH